jgi:threonine aldolase
MAEQRTFASDNNSGVHPDIMAAISAANAGHVHAYGDDEWTAEAVHVLRDHFGSTAEVYPVFNGTGANVTALSAMAGPGTAIVCTANAHITVDECGAPERFTGAKVISVPVADGKLRPADVEPQLEVVGVEHHSQPKAVSIAQATEYGTVYTPAEISELATFCHDNGLALHMDGARLANAAAFLDVRLRDMTTDAGVDALSLGATKNGALLAEAVVLLNPRLAGDFKYVRKSGAQLASKMRYISAQFVAMFRGELWLELAAASNGMAARLSEKAMRAGVHITQPTQANEVFALVPDEEVGPLQAVSDFYVWDAHPAGHPGTTEVRWVCSWDTTAEDVDRFAAALAERAPGWKVPR